MNTARWSQQRSVLFSGPEALSQGTTVVWSGRGPVVGIGPRGYPASAESGSPSSKRSVTLSSDWTR